MARPFAKPHARDGQNRLVSRNWVERRLKQILSQLHFTCDGGGDFSDGSAPGQVHLDLSNLANTGSTRPFAVTVSGTAATVAPGLAYSAQAYGTSNNPSGLGWCVPVIGGTDLRATPAPSLAVSATGTTYICLQAHFDPSGAVTSWPWPIVATSTPPQDTQVVRDTGANTPVPGVYHALIAIVNGGVVSQWNTGNINVSLQWNNAFIYG